MAIMARISQPGSDRMQPAHYPVPVYQFQTQLCSSIDSWKTSLDPIWFWLTESGFGQMDLVRKQASVQESLGLFLANNSKPVSNPQHVYILQGLCSVEMERHLLLKLLLWLTDKIPQSGVFTFLQNLSVTESVSHGDNSHLCCTCSVTCSCSWACTQI